MDEYWGLSADAPQGFGSFLHARLAAKIKLKKFHYINTDTQDEQNECLRYAALLQESPIDIVCMGIGENGHIAFNDPPVADFKDPATVKIVELDKPCRQQQVNEGCSITLSEVPTHALTLTIPALMSADYIVIMVSGQSKSTAVKKALTWPIDETCPASIIRKHKEATLYLDNDSAYQILDNAILT